MHEFLYRYAEKNDSSEIRIKQKIVFVAECLLEVEQMSDDGGTQIH